MQWLVLLMLTIFPMWQQPTVIRVERATLTVGGQSLPCTPGEPVNLPAMPAGARMQTVRFELNLVISQQDWANLQNARRTPIVFKWFRFSGARMFITNVVQDSNAGSSTATTRGADGTIILRAQTANERITSGTWVIAPVYADNTPVLINGRELSYQFRIP